MKSRHIFILKNTKNVFCGAPHSTHNPTPRDNGAEIPTLRDKFVVLVPLHGTEHLTVVCVPPCGNKGRTLTKWHYRAPGQIVPIYGTKPTIRDINWALRPIPVPRYR